MSSAALAMYKGPPTHDLVHTVTHYGIRLGTWSPWSHSELVLDGLCWSSSVRDNGVRSKIIDLNSGRWDVINLNLSNGEYFLAEQWFKEHEGMPYDYRGVARFALPFIPEDPQAVFCFESVAEALGLDRASRMTGNRLVKAVEQAGYIRGREHMAILDTE